MSAFAETRRSEILAVLVSERYLKVAELSQRFGVSQMSIRRDLCQLEQQGLVRRVHGGLVATPLSRLGLEIAPDFITNLKEQDSLKEEIASTAARLVQPGDHLIFDSGELSYLVASALSGNLLTQGDLAAITNSIPVALELAPWPGVELILLGGEYQAGITMSLTGADTLRGLEGLHADKMFLTAASIDFQDGIHVWPRDKMTELTVGMMAACSRVILLALGSSIGRRLDDQCLAITIACTLVTDQDCPASILLALRSSGVEVIQVQSTPRKELCP